MQEERERKVRFHGRVQFKTIRHVADFTDEEVQEGWYRKKDFMRMSEEVGEIAQLVAQGKETHNGEELSIRGLEHLVEEDVADYRAEKMIASIDAVLDEQDEQRDEDINDPDIIAQIYTEIATPLLREAYLVGLRDAKEAQIAAASIPDLIIEPPAIEAMPSPGTKKKKKEKSSSVGSKKKSKSKPKGGVVPSSVSKKISEKVKAARADQAAETPGAPDSAVETPSVVEGEKSVTPTEEAEEAAELPSVPEAAVEVPAIVEVETTEKPTIIPDKAEKAGEISNAADTIFEAPSIVEDEKTEKPTVTDLSLAGKGKDTERKPAEKKVTPKNKSISAPYPKKTQTPPVVVEKSEKKKSLSTFSGSFKPLLNTTSAEEGEEMLNFEDEDEGKKVPKAKISKEERRAAAEKRKSRVRTGGASELSPLVRRRDGSFAFRNKDLDNAKAALKKERRDCVKDSLFKFLDSPDPSFPNGVR